MGFDLTGFIVSVLMPLGLALFVDMVFRSHAKGTTLNFIALGVFLFTSFSLDWLYSCLKFGFFFPWIWVYVAFRALFIILSVLGVFVFNKIHQCQNRIVQVIVSLIVFDVIFAASYGVYDAVLGYRFDLLTILPLIGTVANFAYAEGVGDILKGLIMLAGELIIIYPYVLTGSGDHNEYAPPKVKKIKETKVIKKNRSYDDEIEAIRKYKKLLDDGAITEEEYNTKKKEIMN